jgi:hypothetical protein
MPSLDEDDRKRMLGKQNVCSACKQEIYRNYCRRHDEFFYPGHASSCPSAPKEGDRDDHSDCRTY